MAVIRRRHAVQRHTIKGLRWWIIGLIMLGTVFNYLARSSLSVAAPTLTEKLHMTTQQYSYVVAAFQGAYTVMQPVAGYILDFVGLKIGFAIFAIAWAASNMLHGLATGWTSLAFFRGLLGMSEAAIFPAGMKTISQWFPAKERSIATGWLNTGTSIGAMLAPPLVVYCILTFNWQMAFVVTGGSAFIWVARCGSCSSVSPKIIRISRRTSVNTFCPVRSGACMTRRRVRRGVTCCRRAASGASRFRVFSPNRHGRPSTSGFRSTCSPCVT
jgi:ACS family hexuronate transporter-like MFS transporter